MSTEPDALAPMVLRSEMINKMVAKCGGKVSVAKANDVVEELLAIQMRYYAAIATPEIAKEDADNALQVVGTLQGHIGALIRVGAEGVEHLTPDRRLLWQNNAMRVRDGMNAMLELFA